VLALLPVLQFALLFLWLHGIDASRQSRGVRTVLVQAALGSGLTIALITEVMGGLGYLSRLPMVAAWAVVNLVLLVALAIAHTRLPRLISRMNLMPRLKVTKGILIAGISVYCLGTLVTALVSAPNSFDAMTYHLPRVMHWIQSGSLAHYPTPILRQLHQSPWSEYALLNLQLLHGSDALANCVQWAAYCGCLVTVSLIAVELGAKPRGQLLAALVAATVPMAVLQASGTQTDCIASFWSSVLVLSLLQYRRRPDRTAAMSIAASAALAALTKPTTGLFVMPFILSYAWSLIRNLDRRRIAQTALIIAMVIGVNAPHWSRNAALFHSPLGPGSEGANGTYKYTNDLFAPSVLVSNILRNTAIHLNTVPAVDNAVERIVFSAHELLGLDTSDERTTWTWTAFSMSGLSLNEGSAGNPLHLCMALVAAVAVAATPRPPKSQIGRYWGQCLASYLLFCLILRWQPWHSRLHLPLFVLVAPVTAIGLGKLPERTLCPIVCLIVLCSLPYLLFNPTRALTRLPSSLLSRYPVLDGIAPDRTLLENPRWKLYFYDQLVHDSYRESVDYVIDSGETSVGLYLAMNDYEYPYWALFAEAGHRSVQLHHLAVDNISASLYPQDQRIAPRLALVRHPESSDQFAWRGFTYRPVFVAEHSAVYERAP